jgi:hypothetical protein
MIELFGNFTYFKEFKAYQFDILVEGIERVFVITYRGDKSFDIRAKFTHGENSVVQALDSILEYDEPFARKQYEKVNKRRQIDEDALEKIKEQLRPELENEIKRQRIRLLF